MLDDLIMDNSAAPGGRLYSKPTRSISHEWATERVGFFFGLQASGGWKP